GKDRETGERTIAFRDRRRRWLRAEQGRWERSSPYRVTGQPPRVFWRRRLPPPAHRMSRRRPPDNRTGGTCSKDLEGYASRTLRPPIAAQRLMTSGIQNWSVRIGRRDRSREGIVPPLLAERRHGIQPHGAKCRDEACPSGRTNQQHSDDDERKRIDGADAVHEILQRAIQRQCRSGADQN